MGELQGPLAGTLVLIGQPAEEVGKGAQGDARRRAVHALPAAGLRAWPCTSTAELRGGQGRLRLRATRWRTSTRSTSTIRGVGGHGAYPHTTKDPVVIAAQIVLALQTIVSREITPDRRRSSSRSARSTAARSTTSSPTRCTLQLTVRSYSDEVRAKTLEAIERIARAQAQSAGVPEALMPTVTLEKDYTPSTYNDPALTERALPRSPRSSATERVTKRDPVMGGEDFGQYGRTDPAIPSLIFWVGAVEPDRYAKAMASGEGSAVAALGAVLAGAADHDHDGGRGDDGRGARSARAGTLRTRIPGRSE